MPRYMRLTILTALGLVPCWSLRAQDDLPPPAPTAEISAPDAGAEVTPEGVEVLTSGPLHEAFADTVRYKAEPGITVDREPPQLIEEQPPESRPEGADVVWIPGYWGWDDEAKDYIWITGVYRNRPPGHRWVPGYWAPIENQWQWVSGFWVRDDVDEVTYLPEPPASLDQGPSSPAPSSNYFWNPGCWNWGGSSYYWRAGNWSRCQPGWIWYPTYYNWTPRGYVCSYGRWDRPWATRGLCFAPVRYHRPLYLNAGYFYRPWVAFNSGSFAWNLFVRPGYGHYYVGNYWGNRYNQFGYRPWFAYNQGRSGYDPFYNYYRWSNGRNNPGWDRDLRNAYAQRNRGDFDRPRDFNAYRSQLNRIDARDRTALTVAQLQQERRDGAPRLVQDSARDRSQFRDNSRQFRELNERRRDTEIAGGNRNRDNDRARSDGNRAPRSDVASRGQLNLPPTDRTRTPSPSRRTDQRQVDRSQTERSAVDRSQVDRRQNDRNGRTAGQERSNRNERAPREFTSQQPQTREESNPRSTQSFRANPNSGRRESAIPRELQSRDRSGGDRSERGEFQPRTTTPEARARTERSPSVRSNRGDESSRATQEGQSRGRSSAPAARSAPSTRSFESRARSGGGEARSNRAPQGSFRSAPSGGDRGGGARSTPSFSSPRGGGGGAPAARAPSGAGGGGGNRGGGNPGGGGGGGGGNAGGGGRGRRGGR